MDDRRKLLGASEVSSVVGINPFCTPLKLWSIKTGEIEPDNLDEVEAVDWGTRLERVVSEKFADKHGVKLIARKTRYVHPKFPFLSCELDNIIAGTEELVEIKTVNAWAWKAWENPDELPAHVIVQVMMQLGLSKRKVGWVACLCGGQKYIEKRVEFDQEFYQSLVDKCVIFWQMVIDKTPPSAMIGDDDVLLALHPTSNEQLQTMQHLETAVARRQELSQQIKDLEDEQSTIEVGIKESIGNNAGFLTQRYKVLWTPTKTKRLDNDALKADGIYERYLKETETRRLTIKLNKC